MRLREHDGIIPGRAEINNCKPDAIVIEAGYNVRDLTTPEARAELDELKNQVREHGVLTPLKIRFDGETITLVEGHRRLTVVKELIAEYEASDGKEGRSIISVPVFPETAGTTVEDRDAGLVVSNSGTRLKALELANLIFRMNTTRGMPHELVAQRLGISMPVLKNHLDMRAMPEPVKEQVRSGAVSATHAAKLVKEQPDLAEQIIKDAADEQRRLGKRGRATPQATAKAPGRAKLPATELKSDSQAAAPKSDPKPEPEKAEPRDLDQAEADAASVMTSDDLPSGLPATSESRVVTLPERPPLVTEVSRPNFQQLIAQKIQRYLGKIALLAEENALHERDPSEDLKGFTVELCAEGAAIYREIIGDDVAGAA